MNRAWLDYYLCSNMALFYFYKIVTGDFYYYLNLNGVLRLVIAVLEVSETLAMRISLIQLRSLSVHNSKVLLSQRFTRKVLVDFTMLIHLPGEKRRAGNTPIMIKIQPRY